MLTIVCEPLYQVLGLSLGPIGFVHRSRQLDFAHSGEFLTNSVRVSHCSDRGAVQRPAKARMICIPNKLGNVTEVTYSRSGNT